MIHGTPYVSPTLAEARGDVMRMRGNGVVCPCCDSYCRVYRRKFHSEMARFLVTMVVRHRLDPRWFHVREVVAGGSGATKSSTDGSYLAHWGLVEPKPKTSGEKSSGLYRPTEKGAVFVDGRITVPSHIFLYNNQVEGWSDTQTTIQEALGNRFNYPELMGETVDHRRSQSSPG